LFVGALFFAGCQSDTTPPDTIANEQLIEIENTSNDEPNDINNNLPPEITFIETPGAISETDISIFEFTTNQPATTYASLDSGPPFMIRSPYTTHNLEDGNHSLSIWAYDQTGNKSAELGFEWIIDTPPSFKISYSPSRITNNNDARFKFSANKRGVTYEASIDGAEFTNIVNPLILSGLTEGEHTLLIRAKDQSEKLSPIKEFNWRIETSMPSAKIVFPSRHSLTEGEYITVRGTATDDTGIASITVNGITASSNDAYQNWTANIPLEPGSNNLAIQTTDLDGNLNTASNSILIEREDNILISPISVVQHETSKEIYTLDYSRKALIKVNPQTGIKTITSDNSDGLLPRFSSPKDLAIDSENNIVYISDFHLQGVMAIDLSSGKRTIVTSPEIGHGPNFSIADTLVIDKMENRLLVADPHLTGIISVDLNTGNRELIGSESWVMPYTNFHSIALNEEARKVYLGDGGNRIIELELESGLSSDIAPQFTFGDDISISLIKDICVDSLNNRLLVLDEKNNGLISIDVDTRNKHLVAYGIKGEKFYSSGLRSLTCNNTEQKIIIADQNQGQIIEADLSVGDNHIVSGTSIGNGYKLNHIAGIDLDIEGGVIAMSNHTDSLDGSLALIDIYNGDRIEISSSQDESIKRSFFSLGDIQLDINKNQAYVLNGLSNLPSSIVQVDLTTGIRNTLTSESIGEGDFFERQGINDIVLDKNENKIYALGIENDILAVDLSNGNRSVISSPMKGQGVSFYYPKSIDLDKNTNTLFVGGLSNLYSVDINNGNRDLLWSSSNFGYISALDYDSKTDRILASPSETEKAHWIDRNTGTSSLVIDNDHGSGPPIIEPRDLAYNPENETAFIIGWGSPLTMVDLISGDRVITSR